MDSSPDASSLSRRSVLKQSGASLGIVGAGSFRPTDRDHLRSLSRCPEVTVGPKMIHHDHSAAENCADDHPVTVELQRDVAASLEERYATVGGLIDAGYIPYFDFVPADAAGGWSHWLSPEYIGDDTFLDPARPASILVDNRWWRPMGVMFIATRDGDRVDPPRAVYTSDEEQEASCLPWHAHVGLPGLYSWWKFRLLYTDAFESGTLRLSCSTPWMMHVWALPHPESVYAHDAPPRGQRGGPPAEPAGFETDAVPGEDPLGPAVLPDIVARKAERLLNDSQDRPS